MKPAFSVLFLTTLIGAGQGLALALVAGQFYFVIGTVAQHESGRFYGGGSALALALLAAGLLASAFHLAQAERGWRAASRWRTSWLSREVILLPACMALTAAYGGLHLGGWAPVLATFGNQQSLDLTMATGFALAAVAVLLFVATGMIYACVRFIGEWATPWTVVNFLLMGLASGFTVAAGYAALAASPLEGFMVAAAQLLTLAALVTKLFTLWRNGRLAPPVTLRAAIGVHHPRIRQLTQGFMGGSFNTREYFHRAGPGWPRLLTGLSLVAGFAAPVALLAVGARLGDGAMLFPLAAAVQGLGLLAERWVFFATGRHVQNIYYQRMA